MNSVKNGLLLWFNFVLPALLPFMITINLLKVTPFPTILSKLLSPITSKLFGLSSFGIFSLVCGMISGYPIGAKIVSELYVEKKLSKKEAQYLLSFANNSGPLFIVCTVGTGLLGNKSIGYFLLLIHYLSALIIGIIQPKQKSKLIILNSSLDFNLGKSLKLSIYNSLEAITLVGGYIVFFSMLCSILQSILKNFSINSYIIAFIYGILEVTNGCKELKIVNKYSLSLISGLIAFGGLSIHTQSIGYISSTNLSSTKYILSKIFQGFLAFLLCFLMYPIYAQ